MITSASIGYKSERGKVAYVECRFDGYLSHVGRLLVEHYNDLDKMVRLLCGGDIVSLREDLEDTIFENPKDYGRPNEHQAKVAKSVGDYLLYGNGDYKYLFDGDKWYVVDGQFEEDGISWVLWPLDA